MAARTTHPEHSRCGQCEFAGLVDRRGARGTVNPTQELIFGLNNKLTGDGLPIPEITKWSVASATARLPGADATT